MTTRDFTANVISASKVVPDSNLQTGKASGVWDLNEVLDLVKGGNWPTFGNVVTNSDDVFNTTVYTGNNSTDVQTFNTGLDMSGEGGLIWFKSRSSTQSARIIDTVRGTNQSLIPSSTNGSSGLGADGLTFLSNGFSIGWTGGDLAAANDYVAWSFRKAPKFFDVVKYDSSSGNVTNFGSAGATVSHNLGSVPGMIIVKCTDTGSTNWKVYHRGLNGGTNPEQYEIELNQTGAEANSANSWNDTAPTSTQFTLGASGDVNNGSRSYVAYLFAHNNNDGEFGSDSDQDIIKCGSFTSDGTDTITLGFEPQWLMVKQTDGSAGWFIWDTMRGWQVGDVGNDNDPYLYADSTAAESDFTVDVGFPTATGFQTENFGSGDYIYVAIRRGGMQTPTAASDVFAIDPVQSSSGTGPAFISGFVIDFLFSRQITATQDWLTNARLLGQNEVKLNSTGTQSTNSAFNWDYMNGAWDPFSASPVFSAWMWRRARGYFDVVAYTGTGSAKTVAHNLGVAPEMIWLKSRDSSENWQVGADVLTGTWERIVYLNRDNAESSSSAVYWNNTAPTSSVFSIGTQDMNNKSGDKYIASLFATVAGVSKVGSFTQSGATNVACGFSGDTPSLVILKRTDSTGDWYLFDYGSGIVSGNDPYNLLNSDAAQVTNADIVDPYSGGFATTSSLTDGDYIFYAIAAVS